MTSIDTLKDLNCKAILTLYSYAEDMKKITTDISGNLDTICADVHINQLETDRVIGIIENLTPSIKDLIKKNVNTDLSVGILSKIIVKTDKTVEENKKLAELMCNLLNDRIDKQHKFLQMAVTEIDKINQERRQDWFYHYCYYCFYCGFLYYYLNK